MDEGVCVSLVLAPEVNDALVSDVRTAELEAVSDGIGELVGATLLDEEPITGIVSVIATVEAVVEIPTGVPEVEVKDDESTVCETEFVVNVGFSVWDTAVVTSARVEIGEDSSVFCDTTIVDED